jgi:hypothetical protein
VWRVLKWSGVAVCSLILLAAVLNLRYAVIWVNRPQDSTMIALIGGTLHVRHASAIPASSSWFFKLPSWSATRRVWYGFEPWPQVILLPDWEIVLPLWMPFLLAVVTTAFLWRLDARRSQLGHCRCGYNLTGNVSGICPECGEPITTEAAPITWQPSAEGTATFAGSRTYRGVRRCDRVMVVTVRAGTPGTTQRNS